jgi:penicillin-binding protein 2
VGGVVVLGLFLILAVRLFTLQVVNGAAANGLARATVLKDVEVPALRGEIIARGGTASDVLANNIATWEITVSQQSALNDPTVVNTLATLLPNLTAGQIDAALAISNGQPTVSQYLPYQPVPIATDVNPSTILYIEEHPSLFPGVTAQQTYERHYPANDLAAQVLGYVGAINSTELAALQGQGYTQQSQIGQSGLEAQYEAQLHGVPGIEQVTVNPAGTAVSTLSSTPAIPGDNLYLNMDMGLERNVATSLADQVLSLRATVKADFGAAVVLNAQTGAVLAMSSFPSYNNNLWIPFISQAQYSTLLNEFGRPLNNYAIAGGQTPGSTFKLVTATAALDDGLITGTSLYNDTGTFIEGRPPKLLTLHNNESSPMGLINVSTALAASVDTYFYNLGALFCQQNVGCPTQLQQFAAKYGLGRDPMIDLPNTESGQVDSPQLRLAQHRLSPVAFPSSTYYQGDNVETAFGQGETLVTPLQLADAYATFANGGTRYAPEVAAALVSPGGKVTRIAPKVLGHVALPASTYDPILQGLEGVTQSSIGTASAVFKGFNFTRWNVAGKTGTATSANGVQPVSWFVAFGGPRNRPFEYAVCVEIDQGGYGATASAPVVREIFNYLYQHGIAPLHLPK